MKCPLLIFYCMGRTFCIHSKYETASNAKVRSLYLLTVSLKLEKEVC